MALEQRLLSRSSSTGIALDRLRRRVTFERIIARLQWAEPDAWVLKGGMALEVRLQDRARLTKDIDLGLRDVISDAESLHERVIAALSTDLDRDGFVFTVSVPGPLADDAAGDATWRLAASAELAGRPFGRVSLDVSPRIHELTTTERIALPNSLDFAGIPSRTVEVIDLNRHAAEKLHAMKRDFGDRPNTRVRDLVDIVILAEHGLLAPAALMAEVVRVWEQRDGTSPPAVLPPLPGSWLDRYETMARELGLGTIDYGSAVAMVATLWSEMFAPTEET